SRTKGWLFGYKLHMICSTEPYSKIIPLSAYVTTANVSNKPAYTDVVSSLLPETLKGMYYMVADPGFNGKKLCDLSLKRGFQFICIIGRFKHIPEKRLKLVDFYVSA
ncbi:MAG: transposase, partial [Candidatus Nitrosocosmicus sp.]|nr:transposase [Candidatus Nitrosocosmicus sp.]MDN5866529.1 transposase [Candidatus Nitrosocosmicus sp.]